MIFARKPKIRVLNKRKGGKEETLTVDPICQVLLPRGRGDFRRRGLRPNQGHQRDPQTLTTRLTPFSPRRSHRKGSPSTMAARRRCSALRRSPQAGRARPKTFYSTSRLRRSFLVTRLGLDPRGTRWPREHPSPAEARRRCAPCPVTENLVERPPSGAKAR